MVGVIIILEFAIVIMVGDLRMIALKGNAYFCVKTMAIAKMENAFVLKDGLAKVAKLKIVYKIVRIKEYVLMGNVNVILL